MVFFVIYLVVFYGLLGLASWWLIRTIKKSAAKYPPAAPQRSDISGIGGWLLFLIFTLVVLSPLVTAGQLYLGFGLSEQQDPSLLKSTEWNNWKAATGLSLLALWIYRVVVAIGLIRGRNSAVVVKAKWALWITGPLAALWLNLFIPIIFGSAQPPADTGGVLISSIIWAAIWTAYLSRSRRVAATYGLL